MAHPPAFREGSSSSVLLAGVVAFLMALSTAAPATAELVVLDDGGYFKVTEYRVEEDRAVLMLAVGGRLELPLSRVERVVDDEVVPEEDLPEPPSPALPVRYSEGQAVPPTPWGAEIFAAARRHRVNPAVVAAVVWAESAYDPHAVSYKGARGLMQLMPATAERFGLRLEETFDPERNLDAGVRYLSWLLDRFDGELSLALAAYNAGEGTVDRYDGVPPYRETRKYLQRIYRVLGLELTLSSQGPVERRPAAARSLTPGPGSAARPG